MPDIDKCAYASLDSSKIIDLEQMLCYFIEYFNKSSTILLAKAFVQLGRCVWLL